METENVFNSVFLLRLIFWKYSKKANHKNLYIYTRLADIVWSQIYHDVIKWADKEEKITYMYLLKDSSDVVKCRNFLSAWCSIASVLVTTLE